MRKSLGLSGATGSFSDIDHADAAIILGANPTGRGPPGRRRADQAGRAARVTKLARSTRAASSSPTTASCTSSPRPGTNAAIVLGLTHVVARDGLIDAQFVAERTEGYETLAPLLEQYSPEAIEEITGIPAADLERAAHVYARAENAVLWGLGVTEHKYGSEVRAVDLATSP